MSPTDLLSWVGPPGSSHVLVFLSLFSFKHQSPNRFLNEDVAFLSLQVTQMFLQIFSSPHENVPDPCTLLNPCSAYSFPRFLDLASNLQVIKGVHVLLSFLPSQERKKQKMLLTGVCVCVCDAVTGLI